MSIKQPRFMLITADGTDETRELALESGVDSFMTKPVRPFELINTLNAMFIILNEDTEDSDQGELAVQSSLRLAVDNTSAKDDTKAVDDETVVDHHKLVELDELSEGLASQMITGFVRDGDRLIVDFTAACEARDLGEIFSIAHAIKGAALQLGAQRLADYCKQLKTLKRIDLDSKAEQTLKDMRFLYLEARNLLLAHSGNEQSQTFEGKVK